MGAILQGLDMALSRQFPSPAEGKLLLEVGETPLEEMPAAFGGLPLFFARHAQPGLPAGVRRNPQLKQRNQGLDEAAYVESFLAQRTFAALPETVNEYYFRGDTACYEKGLLDGLRAEERETGPPGHIGLSSARCAGFLIPLARRLRPGRSRAHLRRFAPCQTSPDRSPRL